MILNPDRIILDPLLRIELEIVVIVVRVAVVLVHEVLAQQVIR